MKVNENFPPMPELGLWCLTPLSTIFRLGSENGHKPANDQSSFFFQI
jgi:hypothetical protein